MTAVDSERQARNLEALLGAGAEQLDDITALAIRYLGPAGSKNEELRFTLKNRLEEIARLGERLGGFAALHQLAPSVPYDLNVALEEAVTNIISHGYADEREHEILVRVRIDSGEVIAELKDDARPFNPLTAPDANVTTPLDERTVADWASISCESCWTGSSIKSWIC